VLKKFLTLLPRILLVPPGDQSKKILVIHIRFLESESIFFCFQDNYGRHFKGRDCSLYS
jgi:hypothetical protein